MPFRFCVLFLVLLCGRGVSWGQEPEDIASIPTRELAARGDAKKRFFLHGPVEEARPSRRGHGLLVVLPGGGGDEGFRPFVKRILKNALEGDWLVAQLVSIRWTPGQQIIWPTQKSRVTGMEFTTEEFIAATIAHVVASEKIDLRRIFVLGWSSGGPAIYSYSLSPRAQATGFYIAQSVFQPQLYPPLRRARGRTYFLDHSPQDQRCPFAQAQDAEKRLGEAGARVRLVTYEGGHGWHDSPFARIAGGVKWLEENGRQAEIDYGLYASRLSSLRNDPRKERQNHLEAVRKGLRWLVRHQHPDGHWGSAAFRERCRDDGRCRVGEGAPADDPGDDGYDVGVTGLALLAFLGFGHTHVGGEEPEFREAVDRGYRWLLQRQTRGEGDKRGLLVGPVRSEQDHYNHAVATLALAELLYLSRDDSDELVAAVEQAAGYILRSQNEGFGWRYEPASPQNDSSVTCWMLLALEACGHCADADLVTLDPERRERGRQGALEWFRRVQSPKTGVVGYMSPGDPGSQLRGRYAEPYPFSKELSSTTAAMVFCRLFTGEDRRHESVKAGVPHLLGSKPKWEGSSGTTRSTINFYYWYLGSNALYQHRSSDWKKWNRDLEKALLPNQRDGGCADGSWDPIGEWGVVGGRVYSTAVGVLCLETPYRYVRRSQLK